MSKIRIVTDSTADIPAELCESMGIEVVPLKVHFGEETYFDGVTIQAEQFYEKLTQASQLPTTSQPSPTDFIEVYKRLFSEPDTEIISIHLSSALSGTYQSAVLAKSILEDTNKLHIVDSKSASFGIGVLVLAAAKAANAGKSSKEILELVQRLRKDLGLYFIVDTLEYLQKGGRIGKASAVLGSLLNIKPILTLDDEGVVTSVDKVRGQKKAISRVIEKLKSNVPQGKFMLGIAHSNNFQSAQLLGEMLREEFQIEDIVYTSVGPVIGTHVGPGTVAAFLYSE